MSTCERSRTHGVGRPAPLLHTPGRKSGKDFVHPVVAAPDGNSYIICGSQGGAPVDPQWVANLEAVDGPVTIELGGRTLTATHRVVRPDDQEWERLYGVFRAYGPDTAEYEKRTNRQFPVFVITPR